jgi:hypothetical protein
MVKILLVVQAPDYFVGSFCSFCGPDNVKVVSVLNIGLYFVYVLFDWSISDL